MDTRRAVLALALVALVVAVGAWVVIGPSDFFLPERSTQANETLLVDPGSRSGSATTVTTSADGTNVSGTDAPTSHDGAGDSTTATGGATTTPGTTATPTSPAEPTTAGKSDATVLASGNFTGAAGHRVSGEVDLVRADGDLYLQFRDYEQTQGPDVFVYVTPDPTPTTSAEIRAGTKVRIDGGADGGESTKEGTFVQRLPDGVDADAISGVGIWCEKFATPFGYATLE